MSDAGGRRSSRLGSKTAPAPAGGATPSSRRSSARTKVVSKTVDTYGGAASEHAAGRLKARGPKRAMESLLEEEVTDSVQQNAPPSEASQPSARRSSHSKSASELDPNSQFGGPDGPSGIDVAQDGVAKTTSVLVGNDGIDGGTLGEARAYDITIGQPIGNRTTNVQPEVHFFEFLRASSRSISFQKKWLLLLTAIVLAMAILLSDIFAGPILGAQYDLLSIRNDLRKVLSNGMTIAKELPHRVIDSDALTQRLDYVEAQLSKLTNDAPTFEEKYKIDYFDPRNEATTWPKYTSPEKMRPASGWKSFLYSEVPYSETPYIQGPFANVEKNWCAPSRHGKAQVAVLLPQKIVPKLLVVEQSGSYSTRLKVGSYPRQIELWARDDGPVPEGQDYNLPAVDDPGRPLDPAHVLPGGFRCIGRWDYDIFKDLTKQSFVPQLYANTSAVAVRINSNWGDEDQTCLHNLQLFGESNVEREKYGDDRYW